MSKLNTKLYWTLKSRNLIIDHTLRIILYEYEVGAKTGSLILAFLTRKDVTNHWPTMSAWFIFLMFLIFSESEFECLFEQ